jgi:imidazolonepropionase-like amidohydrolase
MTATLVRGGTLIACDGRAPVREAAVLIRGGRIEAAGPAAQVAGHAAAAGADIVDAAGAWIIPGLIDSHIHATLTGLESMPVFLACGVTTVRDVGGPLDGVAAIRDALASAPNAAPRFIFCGPLIDGAPPSFPADGLGIIASNADAESAAAKAEECIARGAGSIKLYFRLPREGVRAAISRIAGRVPVTGHLGRTRASEAVADGIDGFEHAIITLYNDVVDERARFDGATASMSDPAFWTSLLAGWADADLDAAGAQSLLEAMRERGVTLDATLDITRTGLGTPRPAPDERLRYVRKELVAAWELGRQNERPQSDDARALAERGHAQCGDVVRRYHEIGGRVTAGTDVGAVPFLVPGFSLHGELRLLAAAGLSPADALAAATIEAARALRIDAETGSVEPGKSADLVLLDADPLADVGNVGRVRTVYRAGVAHDPMALLAPFAG